MPVLAKLHTAGDTLLSDPFLFPLSIIVLTFSSFIIVFFALFKGRKTPIIALEAASGLKQNKRI